MCRPREACQPSHRHQTTRAAASGAYAPLCCVCVKRDGLTPLELGFSFAFFTLPNGVSRSSRLQLDVADGSAGLLLTT